MERLPLKSTTDRLKEELPGNGWEEVVDEYKV